MGYAAQYKGELLNAIGMIDLDTVETIIGMFNDARENGQAIFTCGNGGSASSASHFVCDVVKGASFGREKRFRIQALTDSLPTLTAYANDVGYDVVFAEQLKNFARPGDLVMAISGSGNSPNVVKALDAAKELGCRTVALTGRNGGKLGPMADVHLNVPVQHMGRIEDAHMIVCHMIAYRFMEE